MAIVAVLDPKMKMWYITFCYRKIYPSSVKGTCSYVKEYVEMHDAMDRKDASHKRGSFGGITNSRSNEDLLG